MTTNKTRGVVKGKEAKQNIVHNPIFEAWEDIDLTNDWRLCLTYESTNEFKPRVDGNQVMTSKPQK